MTQSEIQTVQRALTRSVTPAHQIRHATRLSHEAVYCALVHLEALGLAFVRPLDGRPNSCTHGWVG